MSKELFEGLEQARKEFNNWQGKAVIYVDFDDMTAWCRVDDCPDYHSDNIICLVGKNDLHGRNDKYGKDKIELLASKKLEYFKTGLYDKTELEPLYLFAEFLR